MTGQAAEANASNRAAAGTVNKRGQAIRRDNPPPQRAVDPPIQRPISTIPGWGILAITTEEFP